MLLKVSGNQFIIYMNKKLFELKRLWGPQLKILVKQIVIAEPCQVTHDSEAKYMNEFYQKKLWF